MNNFEKSLNQINAHIYLVEGSKEESYHDFRSRIFEIVNHLRRTRDDISVKATLTEEKPPAISVIPFRKQKIAAITIGSHSQLSVKHEISGLVGSYVVEQALPVAYTRDWPPLTKTPGICLLTLFRKKRALDHEEFIRRWHNGHTPLSLEIHPLWHYARNVVLQSDGKHYDGIVEEHCRKRSSMLNPARFFGGPLRMLPNMIRVYMDVKGFLDYDSIEPYLVSEYYFD